VQENSTKLQKKHVFALKWKDSEVYVTYKIIILIEISYFIKFI